MKGFFVAGTDTDVGKTFVSCAILHAANQAGLKTMGLKPMSAGCEQIDGELKNDDALRLMDAMNIELPYAQVNPIALKEACSPHIAAMKEERNVSASRVVGICKGAMMKRPDLCLVEGAGGWRVPISHRESMSDIARQLNLPVILVVGLKLGCLNHAMLSAEVIRSDGLKIAGWVGNQTSPEQMMFQEENLQTLQHAIGAPCLGVMPYQSAIELDVASKCISLECLDL